MVDVANGTRIPFGFRALDSRFDGLPPGSAVFLTGEPDAGPDAYAHTSAAMLMRSRYRPRGVRAADTGHLAAPEALPDSVEYVTLTRSRERVLADLESTLDPKQYDVLTGHLSIGGISCSTTPGSRTTGSRSRRASRSAERCVGWGPTEPPPLCRCDGNGTRCSTA